MILSNSRKDQITLKAFTVPTQHRNQKLMFKKIQQQVSFEGDQVKNNLVKNQLRFSLSKRVKLDYLSN